MRAHNFNAGPAGLPLPALERARDELLDFGGSGMSIMEHSHRGPQYEAVHNEALELMRSLLGLPDSHTILFMSGGASLQFAMVPMNFLLPGQSADYVISGHWAERALDEAKACGTVRVAASSRAEDGRYYRVPSAEEVKLDPKAAYVHTTSNNTMYGTQSPPHVLETGALPHVCDMSSDFLSRPIDASRFDLIYAGAQKNLGPSGVLAVIARKSFIAEGRTSLPKILKYSTHAEANSLYNTPPTLAIYLMRNVLSWISGEGGLAGMQARNEKKASLLYRALDRMNDFYKAPVEKRSRSVMNIVFRLPTEKLDGQFASEALKAGLVGLKGHRVAGGVRVSAYNAVSVKDIEVLVSFMESFAKTNG